MLISGGDRGIFRLDVSNSSQPTNLSVFFPPVDFGVLNFLIFGSKIVVFGEADTVLYRMSGNSTFEKLGSATGDDIEHVSRIDGTESFVS